MGVLWSLWGLLLLWRHSTPERGNSKGEVTPVRSGVHSERSKEGVACEPVNLWSSSRGKPLRTPRASHVRILTL